MAGESHMLITADIIWSYSRSAPRWITSTPPYWGTARLLQ
ncbi:hypothetical protein L842_5995 [Mycobacterium intracellulare MIN_052511_1280]|nr:hypothetical protein L842_5995 [Mycobacterium intracellulare MIN_052511_1280]